MSTRNCSSALEWWLRKQNKFNGCSVCTAQIVNKDPNSGAEILTDRYEITKWVVDGVEKPTDNEVEQIIDDYESFKISEVQDAADRKAAVVSRFRSLGFTDEQIEEFLV